MAEIAYMDQIRSKMDGAERLFSISFNLIESTERCLLQARQNLALHEDTLSGCEYVEGVDSPEIGYTVGMSRIGVKYYTRQIERLERYLKDYREFKNRVEDEWKRLNHDVASANVVVLCSEAIKLC